MKKTQVRKMIAAMRAEGAKFPRGYVSPLKDDYYGDGPMESSFGYQDEYGVCGCVNYWSELFCQTFAHEQSKNLKCYVTGWPDPWRKRYQRVKTVRAQYKVMADFVESEVFGK